VPAAIMEELGGSPASLVFSPDGKRIAAVCCDDKTRVWNVESGKLCSDPDAAEYFSYSANTLQWRRGDIRIAGIAPGEALWTGLNRVVLPTGTVVLSASLSADRRHFLITSLDSIVRIWDALRAEPMRVLAGHEGPVFSAVFSPNGEQVMSASWDSTARLWD